MNKFKNLIYLLGLSVVVILTGCSDPDDELTSIDYARLFTPTELTARVVNKIQVRLTWNNVKNADSYTIEVYDNPDMIFEGTPVKVINDITENPYVISGLPEETQYSIRIQAVSKTVASSKWAVVTAATEAEQIFYAVDEVNDLEATKVTLRWPAGETATQIIFTPGNITHTVTSQEVANGVATIEGLTPETKYTAVLKNGSKTRGTISFETPLDLGGATQVFPEDDLTAMLAAAEDNTVFALMPGTYKTGKLSITKNIAIKAAKPAEETVLAALISIEGGIDFELKDVILNGADAIDLGKNADHAIQFNTDDVAYGNIVITGCEIKNYLKGFLYFNQKAMAESITINNCIIYNIECNGGDFFDCRKGTAKQINFTNNTVYNSALARDFFRIDDDNSSVFAPDVPKLLVDHNTLYNVSNASGKRLFYIRWIGNEVTLTNNIVANTVMTLKHSIANVSTNKNNYFNASVIAGVDSGGTTLDPQFKDPANADFTVQNLDVMVGDPRWLNQ